MKAEWRKVKLGDVVDMQYGYTTTSSSENIGPKYLRITDISSTYIDWSSVPHCKIEEKKRQQYALKKGDIVVARIGASAGCAKLIRHNVDSIFASYLIRIIPKNKDVNRTFFGLLIESIIFKKFVNSTKSGAAQPQANAPLLKSFEFNLPNNSTQKRLAHVIYKNDDLIENNEKRIKTLEEMAQRLYTQWFVKFKFPGHEKIKMMDSGTTFGMIPEEWEVKPLSSFAKIIMGQSPQSKFYNQRNEGLPFHQGVRDFGSIFPTNKIYSTSGNRLAEANDLLFSVRAPVGRLNIATEKIILGRGLASIKEKKNRQTFLISMFLNRFTEKDMLGNGAIYKSINKNELEKLGFIYLDSNVTDAFENIATPYLNEIRILSKNIRVLSDIRDLMIENLITGIRRLNN